MLFVNGVGQIVYWKNVDFFLDFVENLIVVRFVKIGLRFHNYREDQKN